MNCQICRKERKSLICSSCHKKVISALDETALTYLQETHRLKKEIEKLKKKTIEDNMSPEEILMKEEREKR